MTIDINIIKQYTYTAISLDDLNAMARVDFKSTEGAEFNPEK